MHGRLQPIFQEGVFRPLPIAQWVFQYSVSGVCQAAKVWILAGCLWVGLSLSPHELSIAPLVASDRSGNLHMKLVVALMNSLQVLPICLWIWLEMLGLRLFGLPLQQGFPPINSCMCQGG